MYVCIWVIFADPVKYKTYFIFFILHYFTQEVHLNCYQQEIVVSYLFFVRSCIHTYLQCLDQLIYLHTYMGDFCRSYLFFLLHYFTQDFHMNCRQQ